MKRLSPLILVFWLIHAEVVSAFCIELSGNKRIAVEWQNEMPAGYIEVFNGKLENITIIKGKGKINDAHFDFISTGTNRIEISLNNVKLNYGSGTTVVSVHSGVNSFSFFLRDVSTDYPIYIPQYKVVVIQSDDNRTYGQIEKELKGRRLFTNIERIEAEPEESFDSASVHTRNQICPAWLGISRDIRIFEIGIPQDMDIIIPRMASPP